MFILGEDVLNTAPLLALAALRALRNRPMAIAEKLGIPLWDDRAVQEAVQHEKGPLFIAASQDTRLDPEAEGVYLAAPDDLARLGFAVAHHHRQRAPDVPGFEKEAAAQAVTIAEALKQAKHPLIISGTSCNDERVIEAGANVAWALCEPGVTRGFPLSSRNATALG